MVFLPRSGKPLVGRYSNTLVRFGGGALVGGATMGVMNASPTWQWVVAIVSGVLFAYVMRRAPMPVEVALAGLEQRRPD